MCPYVFTFFVAVLFLFSFYYRKMNIGSYVSPVPCDEKLGASLRQAKKFYDPSPCEPFVQRSPHKRHGEGLRVHSGREGRGVAIVNVPSICNTQRSSEKTAAAISLFA